MATQKLVGQNYIPPDVEAKVRGTAKYAEDFRAEGMLFAKLYLSPVPHGRVRRIDASAALAMPGVEAVVTADDVPTPDPPNEPILTNEPLYIGDPILAVVAVDEVTAAEALEKIEVDIEPLPFVINPLDSLRPGGPNARSDGNVSGGSGPPRTVKWTARDFFSAGEDQLPMGEPTIEWSIGGDLEEAFAESDLILDESGVYQSHAHQSMEPRSTMAYWQNGKCYLYASNQSFAIVIPPLANYLGIDPENLVFVCQNMGGGFGAKSTFYPDMAMSAFFSKKVGGRPVMVRITRAEEFYLGRSRAGWQWRAKIGFRKDGRVLAIDWYIVQDNGSYGNPFDTDRGSDTVSLNYQPKAMRARAIRVYTNTPVKRAHRGPGPTQVALILEPVMDKAARMLGIDPVEMRKINAPDHESTFWYTRRISPVTSAYAREAIEKGAKLFDWEEKKKLSGRRRGSKVTGVGIGLASHPAGDGGFDGLISIRTDGKVYFHSGVGNLGTYSYSDTFRPVAELLGVRWEDCVLLWGDTRHHPAHATAQAGTQTTFNASRPQYLAGVDAKVKLQEIAAMDLGGDPDDYELGGGRVYSKADPSRGLTFAEAAQRALELGGKYTGHELPDNLHPTTIRSATHLAREGVGLVGVAHDTNPLEGSTRGFPVGFAMVEVDVETGGVDILEYCVGIDGGTVIHPRTFSNQIYSGGVMGMGAAHKEQFIFDPQLGMGASRSLYTAKPPTWLDVPLNFKWEAVDQPDFYTPVGAKGIGEPVMGAGGAALLNAISDALGGVYFNRTPVTRDMILNAISGRPQRYGPLETHV